MIKQRKIIAIAALVVGAVMVVALFGLFVLKRASVSEDISKITIQKNGGQLTVNRSGTVTYTAGDFQYSDTWGKDKTDTFFKHFGSKYLSTNGTYITGGQNSITITVNGQNQSYVLDNNDELVDAVVNDTTGGGGGGGGTSPTATPTSSTKPGSSTPTPTPYQYVPDPSCLYWRLSYCVVKKSPTPAPTATPGPDANVIHANNCGDYLSQSDKPTIISNTLCIPESSPAATP